MWERSSTDPVFSVRCPGLQIQYCQFIQIQLRSEHKYKAQLRSVSGWHCLVWQSKAGLRAWIDCRVEFSSPLWDLNSIGGPRRTRDWAGKGTRGDQGGPSNMLNLRTIPLSKTEPNSGYKSRLISGGYNADCRKVPLHNRILNVKLNVNGQDCNMEI